MVERSELTALEQSAKPGQHKTARGVGCFCGQWGSPGWFESLDYPQIVGIPLSVLDDEGIPAPGIHLWVSSKPSWCSIADNLPQHDTYPDDG